VFALAKLLYRDGASDEAEIIATLAYAARYGEYALVMSDDFAARHTRFDIARRIKGVPILRPKRVAAQVVRYPGHKLPKLVRIEVLSKFATSEEISELYREILQREALPVFSGSPGNASWEYMYKRLVVNVGPREVIEETRLGYFTEYPQVYRFSFPMPSVVAALCAALVGTPRRPGTPGDEWFASGLGDHGRPKTMTKETLIPACVAWHVGEHDTAAKPRDRRRRVAKMLNRHVLKPLHKTVLWDDPYNPEDLVWGDAQQVGPRFQLALLLLQYDEYDAPEP